MAEQKKPKILVIWGDDIGVHNISAYNHGIMGYWTPNVDRLAKEGALFSDAYGEQSCTAGRAAFIRTQKIKDTGPLTKKRMETIDDEIYAAVKFLEKAVKEVLVLLVQHHPDARLHAPEEGVGRQDGPTRPEAGVALAPHD